MDEGCKITKDVNRLWSTMTGFPAGVHCLTRPVHTVRSSDGRCSVSEFPFEYKNVGANTVESACQFVLNKVSDKILSFERTTPGIYVVAPPQVNMRTDNTFSIWITLFVAIANA